MNTASCLYIGAVRHHRLEPAREFQHRIALAYLDLEELPRLLGGRLVRQRPGLVRFRRRDYHGDPEIPLVEAVRNTVARQTGSRPNGPVRVLTQLRSFGHCFNPVSFYYCFDAPGEQLQAVLADVTNTPWGESHAYAVPGGNGRFEKAMHVSPFLGMDHEYRCSAPAPGAHLSVSIANFREDRKLFEASLALERRPLSATNLRSISARYPFATVRVLALIYGHALGIRLAGVKPFPHPGRRAA